jgi:hypothetical protein
VTGRRIWKKVLEFKHIRMGTCMRVCGKRTSDMVRVHIGDVKGESFEESILEIWLRIEDMGEVLSFTRMAIGMTGFGSLGRRRERAGSSIRMKTSMRVNGMRESVTDMES